MDGSRVSPVFYDPERKRWPRIRGGLVVAASVFTVLAAILILSILIILRCPLCPSSRFLPSSRSVLTPRAEALLTPRQRALREAKGRLQLETLEQAMRRRAAATGSPAAGRSRTVAFYVNWDDASMSSLRQNADFWGVRPCLRLCRRKPGSPRLSLSAGEALWWQQVAAKLGVRTVRQ